MKNLLSRSKSAYECSPRWGAPRCRRTVGSAGSCAPRNVGAEVPQTAPANLVVAWCRSRKLSADRASGSGVAHFSCRRPQVVAGDNLGALTGQLDCRESAKGVDPGQVRSRPCASSSIVWTSRVCWCKRTRCMRTALFRLPRAAWSRLSDRGETLTPQGVSGDPRSTDLRQEHAAAGPQVRAQTRP